MKKLLLLNILLLFFLSLSAQKVDTVYISEDYKITTMDKAHFYRIVKMENKRYNVVDYYINGILEMTGTYKTMKPEVKEGLFKYYGRDGKLGKEVTFLDDAPHGEMKLYYSDGSVSVKENYDKGLLHGKSTYYYESGSLRRLASYKKNELVDGQCYTKNGKDTTFYPAEKMPEFIGGDAALFNFIIKSISYPSDAKEKGIFGTVYVKFYINTEGMVENAYVVKSVCASLDNEALRVIRSMPKWNPGLMEGKPASVQYTFPMKFVVK